jgi:dephospho-CoA kinase
LIQADALGHAVLRPDGEAYCDVVREFGGDILDDEGRIDRRRLAGLVFHDPEKLKKLNNIVHPAVFQREERMLEQIARDDPGAIVVVEAAILVETGSYRKFDRIIVVTCSEEQQIERAMKRDSLSREEVVARLSRQGTLEEKLRVADYVIDTSGSKEETLEQVRKVYCSLRSLES